VGGLSNPWRASNPLSPYLENDFGHFSRNQTIVTIRRVSVFRRESSQIAEVEMGGDFGQQTGWIQVGDLAIAFVFPVRIVQTDEPDSKQLAA
jgi:hypothetical protein